MLVLGVLLGLSACTGNPPKAVSVSCELPAGYELETALSQARQSLVSGCEQRFDEYFQRLLSIAEGDPAPENQRLFSEFLEWANTANLLSKQQARARYNRYFGVKFVSMLGDFSICSQACPKKQAILRALEKELADKEQGLLRVSADKQGFARADRLFQETELVLEATCESCQLRRH